MGHKKTASEIVGGFLKETGHEAHSAGRVIVDKTVRSYHESDTASRNQDRHLGEDAARLKRDNHEAKYLDSIANSIGDIAADFGGLVGLTYGNATSSAKNALDDNHKHEHGKNPNGHLPPKPASKDKGPC